MDTRKHNYQNLFSKWLLAPVLLLSFFTFSGLVVQSRAIPNAPQTTWVQGTHRQAVKSIAYKRALTQTRLGTLSFFITSSINLSEVHSKQLRVLISDYCQFNLAFLQTSFFYQHKTIPQNTGDDPAIALV